MCCIRVFSADEAVPTATAPDDALHRSVRTETLSARMKPELLLRSTRSAVTVPSSILPECTEIKIFFCSRVSALTGEAVV